MDGKVMLMRPRVPEALQAGQQRQQDSGGVPFYAYDRQRGLYEATFAQTPSNLTPDSSGYYDSYEAQTRARARYEYDGARQVTWLGDYWDRLGTCNNYTCQAIVGQACD